MLSSVTLVADGVVELVAGLLPGRSHPTAERLGTGQGFALIPKLQAARNNVSISGAPKGIRLKPLTV
jgi:hypothetical protein